MAVNLHLKKKKLLLFLVILGFLSSFLYLKWWIDKISWGNPLYILLFFLVLFYITAQVYLLWIIYLNAKYPEKPKAINSFKVDVFLPTYNEHVDLVETTLAATVNMHYPHTTYLIDDGNNINYKKLAEKYTVKYVTRNNNIDNKAGNINNVLRCSEGDIVAIFDIDHVPQEDYLTKALPYFDSPDIGVVQVALDHSNQKESYVADASCIMNDDFFAATMLGMNELGSTVVFGSNSIFRRDCLLSIGGYQPGLAEDLHTSIKIHSAGWKSSYLPQILAQGLVPADLSGFFKQQLKWASGVFEVLFRKFPPLIKSLTVNQNICYLTRMTYYLAGPLVFLHIILAIVALFSRSFNLEFSRYISYSIPFIIIFFLIQFYIKIFYFIKEKKKGFHVGGYLLVLGSWPIYTMAFFSALIGIKIPFIATPKEPTSKSLLKLIIPQIVAVVIILSGISYKLINYYDSLSLITILFSIVLILIHYGIFYAVWEKSKKESKTN